MKRGRTDFTEDEMRYEVYHMFCISRVENLFRGDSNLPVTVIKEKPSKIGNNFANFFEVGLVRIEYDNLNEFRGTQHLYSFSSR